MSDPSPAAASASVVVAEPAGLDRLEPLATIGRYELLGRLATGGMAEVHLARSSGPRGVRRYVVLKRILPHLAEETKLVESFVQEARVVSRLAHPGLCAVHDFGEEGGFHLVLEWVRGRSLREVAATAKQKTDRGTPIPIAAYVAARVAEALHHAHIAQDSAGHPLGIVHRDVTPENILVGWNGVPKLIDFGIAKSKSDPRKTEAGVLKGKFAYISPEQYRGEELDGRSDVFALSVCLYESLAGESLYERSSEYETVAAILLDPSVPSVRAIRPDVPEGLDAILERGLAKDRDERFSSAAELAQALDDLAREQGWSIRHREVAAWMRENFPGEADAPPKLDRRPPTGVVSKRQRTRSEEMQVLTMGAELDLDEEELEVKAKRRRRLFLIAAVLVALASVGVIASVAMRPRAAPSGEVGTTSG